MDQLERYEGSKAEIESQNPLYVDVHMGKRWMDNLVIL